MRQKIIAKVFVLGFLLVGALSPSSVFAGLFDDDEKRWDYLFKTLKKINLRLSDLETKEMQALKQAQGQMYSQLEEIQRILPSLQGIMEVNKSDIDNRISSLLTKTEEIQALSVNQEQRMQSDLTSLKTELERALQTINNSLESQKTGIINEFALIKEGIAADIKTLADSNTQNFKNFSNAEAQSFKQIVDNLNVQNERIATTNRTLKEELIPTIIQENKNILSQIVATVSQNKEEISQLSQSNHIALTEYLNSIKQQNEKLVKILENTLTVQQTNQNQLVENINKVNDNVVLYGQGFNNLQKTLDINLGELKKSQNIVASAITQNTKSLGLINTNIKTVADGMEKTVGSVNTSMARLQEISNQNSDKLIKINELSLKTVTEKMDRSAEAISIGTENAKQTNNKLVKVVEILKSSANQSKVFDQKLDAAISKVVLSESQTKASDEKLTQLIELFQANAQFVQKLENDLSVSSQKVEENQASVVLANEKLAKLIEILKTIAVSQARVDEVVVAQKELVQSQDQIIAAQQQMSTAQNQIYENQSQIVETQKILAKAQEQATASREQIIRTQAEIKEALADLRRKANVNIARNDDIKKKQDKIEQALKASGAMQ